MNTNIRKYITSTSILFERIEENRRKREEVRMKEEGPVNKLFYTTNIVSLFSFYILKPQSLTSRSDLELLICYIESCILLY